MVYRKSVTTLPNVKQVLPDRSTLNLTKGLCYFLELMFPSGSEGLLHVQINDGGYQVWPSTPGESFFGDDIYLKYDDLYINETEPTSFEIITWNDDDLYQHQVVVGIGLVSKDIFMARFLPSMMYKEFEAVYMRILEEQQKKKLSILSKPMFPISGGA